jgi:antitoxin MazE
MSKAIVGKWGKNLAVRIPGDVARSAELNEGEAVDIEMRDGDIVIRRSTARARALAATAAEEIMSEAAHHSLDDAAIRELLEEGRRG